MTPNRTAELEAAMIRALLGCHAESEPLGPPTGVITEVDFTARSITLADVVGVDATSRYAEICRRAKTSRYWAQRKRFIDRRGGPREDFIAIRGFYDRMYR